MPESLIDHIRRHTTLTPNDATDAAQATVEWLRKHAGSLGFVEGIWLRLAARIIQAEVDREEAARRHECTDIANAGFAAGREAERERIATKVDTRTLRFDLFGKHQFQSSRPWPDGTKPTAPNWNPGCSCGASHYYFDHPRHLAEIVAEHLTGGQLDA